MVGDDEDRANRNRSPTLERNTVIIQILAIRLGTLWIRAWRAREVLAVGAFAELGAESRELCGVDPALLEGDFLGTGNLFSSESRLPA